MVQTHICDRSEVVTDLPECAYCALNRAGGSKKGGCFMRYVAVALIIVGIVGLILSGVLPAIGIPGVVGSVAALLSGIGFLLLCRCPREIG